MLEVEDWTQASQQNKRRAASKKNTMDKEAKDSMSPSPSTSTLQPEHPQAEVDDSFRTVPPSTSPMAEDTYLVTRPPTSHLFPVRSRSNSSPNAGPSSLSRLLAQAPAEPTLETIPPSQSPSPSPTTSPPPPPSPTRTGSVTHGHAPSVPSPLRPGSRASKLSTSSRFSVGRIPALGSASSVSSTAAKTAPTTALSDHPLFTAPASFEGRAVGRPASPSPEGFLTDANIPPNRRRTTSYHTPRTSSLVTTSTMVNSGPTSAGVSAAAGSTFASLANSLGVSFGRRKKADAERPSSVELPSEEGGNGTHAKSGSAASELLKRF
jgi:autophagy-related protein 11